MNPSKYRHLIGEACHRKNIGLSSLAIVVGCSTASIYRWYKGESTPKARFVSALAEAAGITDVAPYLK